ncbi:MAG: alpha-L-fucosidase [Bacteroidales bacterium]|nr:alpha-L-fucosidase [Bacteroidales bacterium]
MREFLTYCLLAIIPVLTSCSQGAGSVQENMPVDTAKMQWFDNAKLGIFIHWGIYAVDGVSESWSFHNGYISHEDYMAQAKRFTASSYDPEAWADLIAGSGAKYTVITSKHHDGVALWDTKADDKSLVKMSPAARDVLTPFVDAVRRRGGVKLGLYYSLIDWSHPDYPNIYRNGPAKYDIAAEPERWQKFLDFITAQLDELTAQYKPDLWWFDGDWEQSAETWKAKELTDKLRSDNPACIINSRIQGYGDYGTPEIGVPVVRPADRYWELCYTINDSWGFQHKDLNFKSPQMVLKTLVDCISNGGNLLLDIGPREDGSIPEEEVAVLKELGRWTSKHSEAVYNTRAGIPGEHVKAYTSVSTAGDVLYIYLPYKPIGPVEVKGLVDNIKKVRIVGSDIAPQWKIFNKLSWSEVPGLLEITVPDDALDSAITVIAIETDGPVSLYRGSGQVITMNE